MPIADAKEIHDAKCDFIMQQMELLCDKQKQLIRKYCIVGLYL